MRFSYIYLALLVVSGLNNGAKAADAFSGMKLVDIEKRISSSISTAGGSDWVISGELDIDGDGELDMLVAASSATSKSQLSRGAYTWHVYFRRGDDYYDADKESVLPFYSNNIEYRRIVQSDGKRALVWHDDASGKEGDITAAWYETSGNGEVLRNIVFARSDSLLKLQDDEVAGAGLSIDQILKNYRRLEPGKGADGATSPEEIQVQVPSNASAEEVPRATKKDDTVLGMAGENITIIRWAALLVFSALGLAMIAILYRRWKAG